MILRRLSGVWWGSDPNIIIMLYKSLIRSKLEYGGFLIFSCKGALFYELQKIQNKCFRIALGYQNTTPINVMTAESKIPYLKFRFEFLAND